MMCSSPPNIDEAFPATRWTLVDRVRSEDPTARRRAHEDLVRVYWSPIYAYMRHRGASADLASELTQTFFTEVMLGRDLFNEATPCKGLLRQLLLASIQRFLVDMHRRQSARERPTDFCQHRIEHEERLLSAQRDESPESGFERRMAIAMLEEALRRTESHFAGRGREAHWKAFEMRVLRPAIWLQDELSFSEIARQCGFAREHDAFEAVRVVRKRLLILLREVVAESVGTSEDEDSEYKLVVRVISGQ